MPPGEQAPRSAYRPNPHSLRSTNACGHKHKKQFSKSSDFSISQPYGEADRARRAKNYQQLPTIKKYASYVKKRIVFNCL